MPNETANLSVKKTTRDRLKLQAVLRDRKMIVLAEDILNAALTKMEAKRK